MTALLSKRSEGNSLEGSTPSPSAARALGRAVRHRPPTADTRVQAPQGTLGDRLTVGRLVLTQVVRVRVLLPELLHRRRGRRESACPGSMRHGVRLPGRRPYRAVVLGTPESLQISRRSGSIPDGPAGDCPGTPTGRAARPKPGRLWVRVPPWVPATATRLGRQSADQSDSDSDMLWVRFPPEPLARYVPVDQSGEIAALSRRRSGVQIPPGTLAGPTASRRSSAPHGGPQNRCRKTSGADDERFNSSIALWRVGWALASPPARKANAFRLCRFDSCPTH